MNAMFLAASILVFVISFSCIGVEWMLSLAAGCAANVSLWLGRRIHALWTARPARRGELTSATRFTVRRAM
jgi:hypothetical protein